MDDTQKTDPPRRCLDCESQGWEMGHCVCEKKWQPTAPDEFKITGPGEYITKEGKKATVEFELPHAPQYRWVGWISGSVAKTWNDEGTWNYGEVEHPHNIVGPWVEPIEAWAVVVDGGTMLFIDEVCAQRWIDNEYAGRLVKLISSREFRAV